MGRPESQRAGRSFGTPRAGVEGEFLLCTAWQEKLFLAALAGARSTRGDTLQGFEAAERAIDMLIDRILDGRAPGSPLSWVREVARRQATKPGGFLASRTVRESALVGGLDQLPAPDAELPVGDGVHKLDQQLVLCLTCRQGEVYRKLCEGWSIRSIARELSLSPRDVRKVIAASGKRARKDKLAHLPPTTQ